MNRLTSSRLGVEFSRSEDASKLRMEILLIQAPSKPGQDAYNRPCKELFAFVTCQPFFLKPWRLSHDVLESS